MPTKPSDTSLWTDRSKTGDHDWLAAAPVPPRRSIAPAPAPEPPAPRRRWRRRALIGGATVAVLGAAVLAGTQIGGDDGTRDRSAQQTLPAAGGRLAESKINAIYAKASKGVVSIQARQGGGAASGTGFVIDAQGTIVTNAHVIDSATTAQVRFDDGGDAIQAEVLGTDASSDLAVLRVNPAEADLKPLEFADSDAVRVGDTAIAIGYPLGLDRTVTAGIVSGLGRNITAPNGFGIDQVIQTDAPINPGNSGGPLLDGRGRVIGVNSQIATAGGGAGNVGIGFAVPSNTARQVVPRLRAGQSVDRAYLGIATAPDPDGGAAVQTVAPDGPAAQAGLQPGGDVITKIDGQQIKDPEEVAAAISGREPGESVAITVRRPGGDEQTLNVRLGKRPAAAP